jgi:DNA-binding transcriptional MerR regulator
MPIELQGEVFYRTTEACQMAGICRATLFRWLSIGIVEDVQNKDRRGWRLFSEFDIHRLKAEANRINKSSG